MRLEQYLTESLSTPYRFTFMSRNTEHTTETNPDRKSGMMAEFRTDNGIYYEVTAQRMGYTKEEQMQRKKDKEERQRLMQADKDAGKRKRLRFRRLDQGGMWQVHFHQIKKGKTPDTADIDDYVNDITGTGDAFRVFATILEFVKELVDEKKPQILSIKSKTEEQSRSELYGKLAKRYAGTVGFKVKKTVTSNKVTRIELVKL